MKVNIVLCNFLTDAKETSLAGAADTIMHDGDFKDSAFSFPIPAYCLGRNDGSEIF